MRTLYDSTTPVRSVPADAQMVAGYVNGLYTNLATVRTAFPNAVHVSIAVTSAADAMVLDVETGDASPADAPAWCQRQRARGQIPTVYCNASTWPQVRSAFQTHGIAEPCWWIADYDGVAQIPPGAIAKQYRSDTAQNLDCSVVADFWPGVDSPGLPKEDDMAIAITEDAAGNIHVAGVTPQGHPLLFTRSTNGAVSVTDLTDAVAAANPNDHTSYTVQP